MDKRLGTVSAEVRIEKSGLRTDVSEIKTLMERMGKNMEDAAARAEARTTANLKKAMAQQIAVRKAALEDYAKSAASTLAKVGAVGVAGIVGAVKIAADYEAMKIGLQAVEGSAEGAERALARMKEVAKLPGLGFREAVEGYTRLRAAGLDAQLAEKSLRGFANALATVGKGRAELDGVTLALSQIAAKGKVSAEEINQIAERVPQIRQVMIKAFGTADTEILQKANITSKEFLTIIAEAFGKLPQATGGAKNAFENFKDTAEQALASVGKTFLPLATKAVGILEGAIKKLTAAWNLLPGGVSNGIGKIAELSLIAGPVAFGVGKIAASIGELITKFIELRAINGGGILSGLAGTLGTGGVIGIGAAAVTGLGYMAHNSYEAFQEWMEAEKRAKDSRLPPEAEGKLQQIQRNDGQIKELEERQKQLVKEKAAEFDLKENLAMINFLKKGNAKLLEEAREIDLKANPQKKAQYKVADKRKSEAAQMAEAARKRIADLLKQKQLDAAEKARQKAEEIRKNREDAQDELYSLTPGVSDYDVKRRKAERSFQERKEQKGVSPQLNLDLFNREIASINAEEKKAAAKIIKDRQELLQKITDETHLAIIKNSPNNFLKEFDMETVQAVQQRIADYKSIGGEKNDTEGWVERKYRNTVQEIERRRQLAIETAQMTTQDIMQAVNATVSAMSYAPWKAVDESLMKQKFGGLANTFAGMGQSEAKAIDRTKEEQDEKQLLDRQREMEYDFQEISRAAYRKYLQDRLKETVKFSDDWAAIMKKIQELEKQDGGERHKKLKEWASNFKTLFSTAFEEMLSRGKNFFQSFFDGFKQMLIRMAAEAAARKITEAIFGSDKEKEGGKSKKKGGGLLSGLLGAASGGPLGAVAGFFGFDDAHNDRIARRWGWDASRQFNLGASDYSRQRSPHLAGAGGEGGAAMAHVVNIHIGNVSMNSQYDIEKLADELGWHIQSRLPVARR